MNPFRLFREWKSRRKVREGIRAYDESRDRPAGPSFPGIVDAVPPKDGRVRVRVLEEGAEQAARRLRDDIERRDAFGGIPADCMVQLSEEGKRAEEWHCDLCGWRGTKDELCRLFGMIHCPRCSQMEGLRPVNDPNPGTSETQRIPPFPDAWRCRTCRWWGKTTFSPAYEGWGSCKREFDRGNKISSPDPHNPEGIETAPDFGCNQWEPKEE